MPGHLAASPSSNGLTGNHTSGASAGPLVCSDKRSSAATVDRRPVLPAAIAATVRRHVRHNSLPAGNSE
eukprot:5652377-Amphidinium_carterae.1